MIISTLPIEHRTKHPEPIFTIHSNGTIIATGSLNGEVRLWSPSFDLLRTIKSHTGSVSSVRFSRCNSLFATSGDDGRVFIYSSSSFDLLHTIVHPIDVTHVDFSSSFIFSSDLSGSIFITRLADFSLKSTLQLSGPITGLSLSPDGIFLAVYSDGTLFLYKHLSLVSSLQMESGTILESISSRISFSPSGSYFSVGLQFNNKSPTIDIFNTSLVRQFSLVGHVAPSEVTAFSNSYFKLLRNDGLVLHSVLAVASQDLALSLWSTANSRPFLLIKHFTNSPILDMYWSGTQLVACSYDGTVKRIQFDELGEPAGCDGIEEENILVFSKAKEIKDNESDEQTSENNKYSICEWNKYKEESINEQNKRNEQNSNSINKQNSDQTIKSNSINEQISDANINNINNQNINSNSINDQYINNINEQKINTINNINNLNSINEQNANVLAAGLVIEPEIKRIKPKSINNIGNTHGIVVGCGSGRIIGLFNVELPERIKMVRTEQFKAQVGIFEVETLGDLKGLSVKRDGRVIYNLNGPVYKVCFDETYLVLYSGTLQVYDIGKGILKLPHIIIRAAFIDLLDGNILIISTVGDFTVIHIKEGKTTQGRLAKSKNLLNVRLDMRYFIVAEYGEREKNEIIYYERELGLWMAVEPEMNSVMTNSTDYRNDVDETGREIEAGFIAARMAGDKKKMKEKMMRYVNMVLQRGAIEGIEEYQLEEMLDAMKDEGVVREALRRLNNEIGLQRFVEMYLRKTSKAEY